MYIVYIYANFTFPYLWEFERFLFALYAKEMLFYGIICKKGYKMNLEVEYVEPTDLAGKTVIVKEPKPVRYPEPYHCKFTLVGSKLGNEYSLFLTLFNAFKDKRMVFVEYIFRYMDKNNIVKIDFEKIKNELNVDLSTLYRWIGSLIKEDLIVKVSKNRYMINPQIVINYRKVKNQKIKDLVEQYRIYKYKGGKQ